MPKLIIIDDLHSPSDTIKVKYKGPNPANVLGMVPDIMKNTMKISTKDLMENDIRWDAIGAENGFYGAWAGKRNEDNWSSTKIRVIVQGEQKTADKIGKFELQVKGVLETKYEYSTSFHRMFWLFYNRHFYNEQRRKYIREGKGEMEEIRDIVKSKFNISQDEFD